MENEVRKVEMSENVADPTGLGLLGLAVVCFVVSTSRVGWSGPTTSVIIPWAVLLGSIAQLIASYFDFKKNNPFGSVVSVLRFVLVRYGWRLVDPNGLLRS